MPPSLPPFNLSRVDQNQEFKLPKEIIVVPLKDIVLFPSMVVSVYVRGTALIELMNKCITDKELVAFITQHDPYKPAPPVENLHSIGTAATILQVIKGSNDDAMVLIEGLYRIRVQNFVQPESPMRANVELIPGSKNVSMKSQALMQDIKDLVPLMSKNGKALPSEMLIGIQNMTDADQLADLTCSFLSNDLKKKQQLLEMENIETRLQRIVALLNREIQLLKIRKKIHADINQEMNKSERDFLLRQELKAIRKELGEKDNGMGITGLDGMDDNAELKDLDKQIQQSGMPADVKKIAVQELDRLKKIFPYSPEFTVARTYIEWLCVMPWKKSSSTKIDIKKARKILDEDHYGLEKIKDRILEYLAVCQLNKTNCGSTIICFTGPPGVGKTSLGRSIARALGRQFIHTSIGGIRDEADIRGHRRTYVGALPGRIIQSIRRSQCNDPVFMLDEVDKIGHDFQGDPAAALLEALDPEQNNHFTDHYLDAPFDLSKVLFITTSNVLDTIPPALLDRMEVIELPGYTEEEKLEIAKKYLIPKQFKMNGLDKHRFTFTDEALSHIIRYYTGEAGLRELERELASICRKVAKQFLETKKMVKVVAQKDVATYLGVEKYEVENAEEKDMVGVATGLAWTSSGGEIIFVEATRMKGSKSLILTGNLGEVMEESVKAALSFVRSHALDFGIKENAFEKFDIHVHVPEGATPKDGPSAGITMCTALVSLMTGKKVRHDVAMTGEITLTGRILPIGGLKEKILAARRARIKTIIIPERNRKDLTDIPKHILKDLTIHPVTTLGEVMRIALVPQRMPPTIRINTKVIQLSARHRSKKGKLKMKRS